MELIEVFDENNKSLEYSLDRKVVHEQNLWHRHVSAWVMNNEGKVLLQQRALTKMKNPGMWAKTGGHVDFNESPEQAIKREIFEEIGLKVKDEDITCIEEFKSNNPSEHYFSYGYLFLTNLRENDFILQKEEVAKVRYFEIEELEKFKRENSGNFTFLKWDEKGFNKQMEILKQYRKKILEKRA